MLLLVFPDTVTVTLWFPPADVEFEGVKVAVIWVDETNCTFDTEMFDPAFTVAPDANPDPAIVTLVATPTGP